MGRALLRLIKREMRNNKDGEEHCIFEGNEQKNSTRLRDQKSEGRIGRKDSGNDSINFRFGIQVRAMDGEVVLATTELPFDCYNRNAHHVVTERLPLDLPPRRIKLVIGGQALEEFDNITIDELATSAECADVSADMLVLEFMMATLPKPEKTLAQLLGDGLGDDWLDCQLALDESLLTAVSELDEVRVDALLLAGADAKIEHPCPHYDYHNLVPLHLAARQTFWATDRRMKDFSTQEGNFSMQEGNLISARGRAVIMMLLDAGADPASIHWNPYGSVPEAGSAFQLTLPAILFDVPLLRAFLNSGADPNTLSNARIERMYEHVLHMAIALKQPEAAKALLEAGAHIDAIREMVLHPVVEQSKPKWAPLVVSEATYTVHQRYRHEQLIEKRRARLRRDGGADTGEVIAERVTMTALHVSCAAGDLSMSAWLLAHGANPNVVIQTKKKIERKVASGPRSSAKPGRVAGGTSKVQNRPASQSPAKPSLKDGFEMIEETPLQLAINNGPEASPLVALLVLAGADTSRPAGEERKQPAELCKGRASLLGALRAEWSNPSVQGYFPTKLHADVEAAIAFAKKRAGSDSARRAN